MMEGTIPRFFLKEAHSRGLLGVSCVFLIRLCIDLQRLAAPALAHGGHHPHSGRILGSSQSRVTKRELCFPNKVMH
jgi:hypothetical protein